MKKKFVLFDLDGTLTDSQEGIINSIIYCLKAFRITPPEREALRPWLGPPLKESLMTYYGMTEQQALGGVAKFREYFNRQGIFENRVYAGVEPVLKELLGQGYRLLIATSKPEPAAQRIVKHFHLESYFSFVGGATLDDSRTKKADVIRYVLSANRITDVSEAMMIGDRMHDVAGAKANGLEVTGVLYGYGTSEELLQAGADHIAETADDILKFV